MQSFSDFLGSLFNYITALSGLPAYATIVGILLVCGLGVPIPEDITLIAAGLLVSAKSISMTGALIAGFFGVLVGDAFMFFLGKKFGRRVFLLPGLSTFFNADRIAAAELRVKRNGPFICFVARFLPGLRSPVFATAGAMGVRPLTFFLLDGIAALLSVPLWIYVGFWFGTNWEEALKKARNLEVFILSGIALLVIIYVSFRMMKRKRDSVAPSKSELQDRE